MSLDSSWSELNRQTAIGRILEMNESLSIAWDDLEPVLREHTGKGIFAGSLAQTADGTELLCVLSRYIHFNSVFGSGVANLAGEIGSRQDLFRDSEETVAIVADRSVEVAADVFFAAIDEFGDHNTIRRSTHRTLAQATLKAAGSFFELSSAELDKIAQPCEPTLAAIHKVRDGYRINQKVDEPKIFRGIGFHIGSEVLADQEFNVLDAFLRTNYPDLVEYLVTTKVPIGDSEIAAYRWIQIHTSVEADHFKAAIKSANLALRYYAGAETQACVKGWILDGLGDFADVQTEFMKSLMERQERSSCQGMSSANPRNDCGAL